MNYKLLWIPTTLFASALTLAIACEPCVGDECDFDDGGGEGGAPDGSGGASGGTTSSGGAMSTGGTPAGGEGGMGGTAQTLDCLDGEAPIGTSGSCQPTVPEGNPSYECQACVQEYCCDLAEACAATGPQTACYYGSTSRLDFYDDPIVGEVDCILDCLREISDDDFTGTQYDVDTCAQECGSAECDDSQAGPASIALAACMIGVDNDEAPAACQFSCGIREE